MPRSLGKPNIDLTSAQPALAPIESEEGVVGKVGRALVKPLAQYGSYVGEAGAQAARFATTPSLQRTTFPGVFGQPTEQDYEKVSELRPTFVMQQENLGNTRGDIALEGAKRTAGAAAYAVPGGSTTAGALASGLSAGALSGFGASKKGEELQSSVLGGAVGLGTAGLLSGASQAGKSLSRTVKEPIEATTRPVANTAKSILGEFVPRKPSREIFQSAFAIPRKIQERMDLDLVADKMTDYGISGNMQQLRDVSDKVTGGSGILSRAVRSVLGNIKSPINTNAALDAAQFAADDATNVDDVVLQKTLRKITNMISKRQGDDVAKTSAIDVWDVVKGLENEGYSLLNKSTDLSPSPSLEQQGDIYLQAASALKEQIDQADISEELLSSIKAKYAKELSGINPKLAEEFMSAKNISEIRRLAKPFVDLSQAARITQANKNTPMAQFLGYSGKDFNPINPASYVRAVTDREGVRTGAGVLSKKSFGVSSEVSKKVSSAKSGASSLLKSFTKNASDKLPAMTSSSVLENTQEKKE